MDGFGFEEIYDAPTVPSKDPVTIKLVTNEEGVILKDLVEENGYRIPEIPWDDVYPYWLSAIVDDKMVGAIQLQVGKPLGCLEFLVVKPGLRHRVKALVVRDLIIAGEQALLNHGCRVVGCFVSFERKDFKAILKDKFGALTGGSGNFLVRRLR